MAAAPSGPHVSRMRGRAVEIDVIDAHVRAVEEGQGRVVLIQGPGGVGKTRLLSRGVAAAIAHDVPIALGSANEAERLVPLAPLLTALAEHPDTRQIGGPHTRLALRQQVRYQLEERVAHRPMVVALDNLQWADPTTLLAVQSLASQLAAYPLLWLLAARCDEPSRPLERVFERLEALPNTDRIRLGALTPRAVAEVIGDVLGGEPDPHVVALAASAGGNPLLLVQLVDHLRDEGAVDVIHGRARVVPGHVPGATEFIMAHRLAKLSPQAGDLLAVAAVMGRSFLPEEAAEALGRPLGWLLPPLGEALDAGVLVATDGALAFRHHLVRQAVYEGLLQPVRLALHRQIARLLMDRDSSAASAAVHLLNGALPGDRQALAGLDRAAREVLAFSPSTAADLALRAFELTASVDGDRFVRAGTYVDALVAAGRVAEAADFAQAILTDGEAPAAMAARLRLVMSSVLFMTGRTAEALAEAEAVLAEPGLPDHLYTAAELARLLGLTTQEDWERVRGPAEAILAGRARLGDDAALAGALTAVGFIAWDEGRVAGALSFLRAAVQRADRGPPQAPPLHARLGLANMLTAIGEFDEAAVMITESRREIDLLGDTMWAAAPAIAHSRLHLATGRLDDAVAEAEVGLATAEELGTGFFVPMALWTLASVALLRGDLGAAAQHTQRLRAEPGAYPEGASGATAYSWIEARLAEATDGPAQALKLLPQVLDELATRKRLLVEDPAAVTWLVRATLAVGDGTRVHSIIAWAQQLAAANNDIPSLVAAAAHARGLLDRDAAALEQAADGFRHPWARGSAYEDAGAVLAVSDRAAARSLLQRALSAYEQAGADRDADRVRARLQDAGARHVRGNRPVHPASGWASLTATERLVSGLVSEGLTNRQIADRMVRSRHTVDFHLRQVFRKLNISSRVQLTRLTLERDEGN